MKNVGNNQKNHRESASFHPVTIIPAPINSANVHFIQPGISKPHSKTKDGGINPSYNQGISACRPLLLEIHERSERFRVEARTAHKRAIQFFLRQQPVNVVRLDAAAIENAEGAGMTGGKAFFGTLAEKLMGRPRDLRRRRTARTDSPNWLVGN